MILTLLLRTILRHLTMLVMSIYQARLSMINRFINHHLRSNILRRNLPTLILSHVRIGVSNLLYIIMGTVKRIGLLTYLHHTSMRYCVRTRNLKRLHRRIRDHILLLYRLVSSPIRTRICTNEFRSIRHLVLTRMNRPRNSTIIRDLPILCLLGSFYFHHVHFHHTNHVSRLSSFNRHLHVNLKRPLNRLQGVQFYHLLMSHIRTHFMSHSSPTTNGINLVHRLGRHISFFHPSFPIIFHMNGRVNRIHSTSLHRIIRHCNLFFTTLLRRGTSASLFPGHSLRNHQYLSSSFLHRHRNRKFSFFSTPTTHRLLRTTHVLLHSHFHTQYNVYTLLLHHHLSNPGLTHVQRTTTRRLVHRLV